MTDFSTWDIVRNLLLAARWTVLLSLVSFIGMTELFQTSRNMAATTYEPLTAYIVVAIYYLVIVLALTALVAWLEHRLSAHRRPEADAASEEPTREQEGLKA